MNNFVFKRIAEVLGVLLLASLYPGYPTIKATEDCSLKDADRCVELNELCAPSVDPIHPSLGSTDMCINDRHEICARCDEAIKGYDMGYWDRLMYYGPFWFKYVGIVKIGS